MRRAESVGVYKQLTPVGVDGFYTVFVVDDM